ncbi:hypothetical protein LOD99_5598 [Oopsacas minuta]|uniref:RING-type domain-containing protein n=1 Tax=Oopsacas minuta TaxID=111878 RepID=A0AAV7JQA1_9METZ|nr:hypothetical protein LOD99_5598 [Oopsacas minuta]
MQTQSKVIEEIQEFFSCSGCKKLQKSGHILMCSHLICTGCLPSHFVHQFHCPACKRDTLITPHAFYGILTDQKDMKKGCKQFQDNFLQFAEEQDAAFADQLEDKIREIEQTYAAKIKELIEEKETKIKIIRKEHSDQLGDVSRRNSKVKEILKDVIDEKPEVSSGSQSDSSPSSSPAPTASPTHPSSPTSAADMSIDAQVNDSSYANQLVMRKAYQRKHRQGDRKAFKLRRGAFKHEETCPIITSPVKQECIFPEDGPTHFTKSGIQQPTIIFGKRGNAADKFKYPRGLAVDISGDIFVVDSENPCIRVWSSEGDYKHSFGNIGNEKDEFGNPWGITIYQEKVYVTDIEKHKIFVYKTNGKYVTSFGKEGVSLNCLKQPRGIFASEEGDIYVADSENNRIQVFSESLKHKCFIGDDHLVKPRDVFVDENENTFVLDWGSTCIHVYNTDGELQREFGIIGNDCGQLIQPWFFTMDKFEQLILSDGKAYKQEHCLKVFSIEGKYKYSIGAKGGKPGMFVLPRGIRLNESGRLIVSDSVNHRVQIF